MTLIKGFKDYTEEEAVKRAEIKRILIENFENWGFEPAETPIIEYEEFVKKGNENDEAISDVYILKDKGKRKLALRYELTFQLKRLMENKKLPYKRYQIGEVFRDEPTSSQRFRQFTQGDIDVIGSTIKDEAEILALSAEILGQLGIRNTILINNRKLLNEILDSEKIKKSYREEILKEIDKYDKIPEKEIIKNLKKYKAEKILSLLKKGESYFKKFKSYKDILELIRYCNYYGVSVLFSPTIVRGLSYYNGNVFEIKGRGIKETITGGGSYKFKNIQCTGISLGLERLSKLLRINLDKEKYLVVSLNKDKEAIRITKNLRNKKKNSQIYYGKPSKALQYANSKKFTKVIFIGEEEIKSKKIKIKDLKSGKEEIVSLAKFI
jgi:histidyl-tRNA synthetase